jgi:trigger factor
LKIETQPMEEHQVRIIAEFEPEVLEKYKQRAARKISESARIPGFRPGKAPLAVIRRMYGEETIEHEAIDLMMDDEYMEVIKQAGVTPAAPGKLDKIVSTNPAKFEFIVPLAPEVKLGDYHSIRQPYQVADITEDRVDQVIKNMRASYSTAEPVERPVQEGDLVSVKVSGVFSTPVEGEDAPAIPESTPQVIVGENDFEVDDWPYEGFTRELVGMSLEEEKEITHTFAADDPEEKLRSKDVKITAKVTSVKSLTLPEMNDEFAQTLGEYKSVEDLRTSIRKTLEENEKREYDNKYMTAIVDQIRSMSTIEYPPQVLEDEIDRVVHSLEDDLAEQKMDLTTYLKTINKDKDAFVESEAKPVARQRLERSLVLDEIAHSEKIELDMEALQAETSATMAALQNDPEFKKMARGRKADDLARGVTMEAANRVLNRQVMARLKAIATGEFAAQAATLPVEAESVLSIEPPAAENLAVEPVTAEKVETPSEPKEKKPRKKKTEVKAD